MLVMRMAFRLDRPRRRLSCEVGADEERVSLSSAELEAGEPAMPRACQPLPGTCNLETGTAPASPRPLSLLMRGLSTLLSGER